MLVLAPPVQAQPTDGFRGMDVLFANEDPDGEAIDDMSQVDCYRYPLAYDYEGWIELELLGQEKDIEAGIAWLISKGVRVDPVGGS